MATEMTVHHIWLTDAGPDGLRRFILSYNAPNFNDTELDISDGPTNIVFGSAASTVFIEKVNLGCYGAAPGVHGHPYLSTGRHTVVRLPPWTTTQDVDAVIYDVQIGIPRDPIIGVDSATPQWFFINGISGYAATDDFFVKVWGWIDTPQSATVPVSLEAYKWPLVRTNP